MNHIQYEEPDDPRQMEIVARMTPEQRLAVTYRLWNDAWALHFAGEKSRNPHLSDEEIRKRVVYRFLTSHT